ncbi:Unsaturated rhamnogalacturonyl hydrolase [Lachnellula hyalina]|uniref:Unsaturated rhamnogalacturonyl hydrolase n=1 Tax=Lachnellula hyalina TaxID=1316788 RepID=A0A8H8U3J6_9HELO|nr:Unsaturated rhamnogalacturonyl hydrolase [Lachnellula hyalina]TVY29231.1 Unsaturated rhamnogalacturonyl hydrolase [Lachnellula hyalina]
MFFNFDILALLLLIPASYATQPYSTWMSDSFMTRGVTADRHYANAVLYRGFELAYNKSGNATYYNYIKSQVDQFVDPAGNLGGNYSTSLFSLDDLRIGPNLLFLYQSTQDARYKTAAGQLRAQLDRQPRTPRGGFWHRSPDYPNQMWLDGIYMAEPFYAQWNQLFDASNVTAWDDIILQFDLIEEHCRNKTSNLLVHGYDESKVAVWADPVTGAAPHVWDRALGWYFMALIDVLDHFPESHSGYAKLLGYMDSLAVGVKAAQDAAGGWWLVMDAPYPGMKGNYIESSATAMFTFSFLKAIRLGYIDSATYLETAQKAYGLMTTKFVAQNGTNSTLNWEGTVVVGSLGSNATFEYYIGIKVDENDFKGAGPFIYASYEIELLDL